MRGTLRLQGGLGRGGRETQVRLMRIQFAMHHKVSNEERTKKLRTKR